MTWPNFFPTNCPPDDVTSAYGVTVYRLINGNSPKATDFKSYRELHPGREFKVPECQVCSISVYTSFDDINRLKKRIPSIRKKKVSKGVPVEPAGVLKHTPSNEDSHHSWWIPEGAKPWFNFEVLACED